MPISQNASADARHSRHPVPIRLLRGLSSVLLANPFAFVVLGVSVWLLAHLFLGLGRALAGNAAWSISATLGCGACLVSLVLLAGVAAGHIVLTWITGWRGD